jgi:hypothetical protein
MAQHSQWYQAGNGVHLETNTHAHGSGVVEMMEIEWSADNCKPIVGRGWPKEHMQCLG